MAKELGVVGAAVTVVTVFPANPVEGDAEILGVAAKSCATTKY